MDKPGDPYQPSNGTEGECFFQSWCCHCQRDKAMREGADFDECDDDEKCDIIAMTMAHKPKDPDYPKEWTYDAEGVPICTAFIEAGNTVPEVDTLTGDLFAGLAP